MTPEQFVVIFVALMGWLFFGMLGALVASQKQAGHTGFLLGLLGPFGFIASFAMDGRKNCPHCNIIHGIEIVTAKMIFYKSVWNGVEKSAHWTIAQQRGG